MQGARLEGRELEVATVLMSVAPENYIFKEFHERLYPFFLVTQTASFQVSSFCYLTYFPCLQI